MVELKKKGGNTTGSTMISLTLTDGVAPINTTPEQPINMLTLTDGSTSATFTPTPANLSINVTW